ncbi:polysaccharide biosynthesis C-terminal domain-containing protein [Sphingobacterium sp. E70]|uniref:lipopolysaccharide biosynthesis protein n=1 Tax=Sphingobacterium sp. E70 TaxID=2853439 RepID=UPI00211BA4EB|nr:polysaccharide biosynthesis C-terminal domain-containing protein [Sphingobacterium sp. E70]ULT28256.1 polysaccharide biosynthesis C-terminal domain-containing protein [Sphingobacterium sp. E70]
MVCLVFFFLFRRNYLKFSISKSVIKGILLFGIPLIPHALSIWLRAGADRIIITRLVNEYYTGLYATGFQFGVFISFITMAFNNAFVPFLYKNLSEADANILYSNKLKLVKLTYICLIAYALLAVFFLFFSDILIRNLFSSKYLESKDFIIWAIISQAFQGFYLLFVNYLFFTNKTKLLATITITCSILQVTLSYVLVDYLGAIGAAYSSVVISFINFIAVMFAAIKAIDMPWKYWIKNNINEK